MRLLEQQFQNPLSPEEIARVKREEEVALAAEQARKERAATRALMSTVRSGDVVPGKGVYVGIWAPRDENGESLKSEYYVFGAPEDLEKRGKRLWNFNEASAELASRKRWAGFDGRSFSNHRELYKSLADGSYDGEWLIPPLEIVDSFRNEDMWKHGGSLYDVKNRGAFAGSFSVSGEMNWYWTCTEYPKIEGRMLTIDFDPHNLNNTNWAFKESIRMNVRPCRLERVPSL
jgi:hypothetical protein